MKHKFTLILSSLAILFSSCETRIVDSEYPDQKVYLPAAVSGTIYTIDEAYIDTGSTPTEGAPFQFVVDYDEATFTIPLSVYRSGLTNDGNVDVQVWFDDDIIDQMYIDKALDATEVEILDADLRACPDFVRIQSGTSYAPFGIVIDLDYLLDQSRFKKKFAFAVAIDTDDREVNRNFDHVVIVIDTQLFENL